MKVLVTGGAGFIGSHLVDHLIDKGHDVVVVDDLSAGKEENINKKAKFYKVDIGSEEIDKVLEAEKVEVINHLAAQSSVPASVADPLEDCKRNVLASLRLIRCALKLGVTKVIFASTGGALYGHQTYYPANEQHPIEPLSPYGICKMAVEKYLNFFWESYGLKYVALRYSNVYGPRQDHRGESGVVAIFACHLLEGRRPTINGSGEQTRDFLYVSDAVKANEAAMATPGCGSYNVGTGVETSVNEIFRKIRSSVGCTIEALKGPAKKGEPLRSSIDPSKIRRELGWAPEVELDLGLKLTVEFFSSRLRSSAAP